jgi:hypothetical protein
MTACTGPWLADNSTQSSCSWSEALRSKRRTFMARTALGQALWSAIEGDPGIDYVPIIEMFIDRGAVIPTGAFEWPAEQESRGGGRVS